MRVVSVMAVAWLLFSCTAVREDEKVELSFRLSEAMGDRTDVLDALFDPKERTVGTSGVERANLDASFAIFHETLGPFHAEEVRRDSGLYFFVGISAGQMHEWKFCTRVDQVNVLGSFERAGKGQVQFIYCKGEVEYSGLVLREIDFGVPVASLHAVGMLKSAAERVANEVFGLGSSSDPG